MREITISHHRPYTQGHAHQRIQMTPHCKTCESLYRWCTLVSYI